MEASGALSAKGPYTELAAFAAMRALPYAGTAALGFDTGRGRVALSLTLDSGRVCGLVVDVAARAYPEVTLRRETDDDRAGKARGTAVEHQTGDAAFDAAVYVASLDDEDAPRVMLTPAVRAAALALFDAGCTEVVWGRHGVRATLTESRLGPRLYDAAQIDGAVSAALALALAPVPDPRARRRPPGAGLLRVTTPLMLGSTVWMIFALVRWSPVSSWFPFAAWMAGLVAWVPYRALVARVVRGGSSSHTRHWIASVFGLLGLPSLCVAAAVTVNGALDAAPPVVERGRIVAVGAYDSEESEFAVTARWEPSGVTATTSAPRAPRPHEGDAIAHVVHPGALGFAWGDAKVVTPSR